MGDILTPSVEVKLDIERSGWEMIMMG